MSLTIQRSSGSANRPGMDVRVRIFWARMNSLSPLNGPVFDHGAALLSDTTLDYPLGEADAIYEQIACVHAKTVSQDFREQLETGEQLFGSTMQFYFENHDLEKIIFEEPYYPEQIKDRVYRILLEQKRKYQYLWR